VGDPPQPRSRRYRLTRRLPLPLCRRRGACNPGALSEREFDPRPEENAERQGDEATFQEERRKTLLALLGEGAPFVVWDNITRGTSLTCPSIEAALDVRVL
jgi:hypothetical protein